MAGAANFHRGNADFGFCSTRRLLQRDFQVVAQISTAIDVGMPSPPAEDISKYISKCVSESLGAGPACDIRIHSRMAMLVICHALLWVGKYFVSFLGFLKV